MTFLSRYRSFTRFSSPETVFGEDGVWECTSVSVTFVSVTVEVVCVLELTRHDKISLDIQVLGISCPSVSDRVR